MKFLEALNNCANSPFAYGYADFSGNIFFSWGETPLSVGASTGGSDRELAQGHSLQFGDFFSVNKRISERRHFSLEHSAKFSALESAKALATLEAAKTHSATSMGKISGRLSQRIPDETTWRSYCQKIEAGIAAKKFVKIVPARSEVWEVSNLTSLEILERLFAKPDGKTIRFFLAWEGELFLGASPELLFEQRRGELYIPCIAGTKAFDSRHPLSAEEKQQFLFDGKEREEHLLVVRGILEALKINPRSIQIPAPSILELPGLLHLFTPLHLSGGQNSETLLQLLHPTPAVGGYPRAAALEFLATEEPWPRGKFASPLVFQDSGGTTAVVAIRSAVFAKNQLTFFAGAGYVKGSTPEKEWQETEKKMQFLKNILGLTGEDPHGN